MYNRENLSWRKRGRVMSESFFCGSFICTYCCNRLSESEVVIDHITPLAIGGDNSIDNLQVTCSWCNSVKGCLPHENAETKINAILDNLHE